jgi:hypothetical protein
MDITTYIQEIIKEEVILPIINNAELMQQLAKNESADATLVQIMQIYQNSRANDALPITEQNLYIIGSYISAEFVAHAASMQPTTSI